LCNIKLLLHSTKPIIGFQRISGMCEHWGTTLQKFTTLITWLSPSNWLILLILHQLLHKLRLHCQYLLNSWWRWWWWIWGNTSMTPASSSSGHLPFIKM
jgi:hypothetical protein